MKVTIITVTYNSAATLEQTILSVSGQSYPHIEYIVVDGKSTDDTLKILEKYSSRIDVLISENDHGLYDALNKGLKAATGDVIGILHSDDFYTDSFVVEKYVRLFEEKDCEGVYADLYYVGRNDVQKIVRKWKSGEYKEGAFLFGWMPPHPTLFLKREVYQKHGTFRTDFKSAADYEIMLRFIHVNKIRMAYLPEFTVYMRAGGKSNESLKSRIRANMEDHRAWRLNHVKPRFYTLLLKPLRKILQFI